MSADTGISRSEINSATTRVLFLIAEADPLVKVGGLGDVGGSLPLALSRLPLEKTQNTKLDVRLVLPLHSQIDRSKFPMRSICCFEVQHIDGPIMAEAFQTEIDGMIVYLIAGPPIPSEGPVYSMDARADGSKFVFFSLAALELARYLDWRPHILHANDWHTALSIYALCLMKPEDSFYEATRSVLTLHNLPFMGVGTESALAEYGLPPSRSSSLPEWSRRLPLPLGLISASRIVAVSPTYAQEILTPEFGCGLEDFLKTRTKVISGILNGIDTASWDPETDSALAANFNAASLGKRGQNRTALREQLNLSNEPGIPLLALISRMDPQKGVDLALDGLKLCANLNWQAVILGTGDPLLEAASRRLEEQYPDRVRAVLRFDGQLSRQIYAGADLLLMPSRYEPCGLAQMIAMRYGCVPLARATGGLKDTIQDGVTGLLFAEGTPAAFLQALKRTLDLFPNRGAWTELQQNGMALDFSWQRSAAQYAELYANLRR